MAGPMAPRRSRDRLASLALLALAVNLKWGWSFLGAPLASSASRREATSVVAAAVGSLLGVSLPRGESNEALAADASITGVKLAVCEDEACQKPFEGFSKDLQFESSPLGECKLLSPEKPSSKPGAPFPPVYARLTCTDSAIRLEAFATKACTGRYTDLVMSNGRSTTLPNIGGALLTWSAGCGAP
eukprot:TRINITY_DN103727_c0_g1_i1.p2 TRINITY_DN103727_c0_g1~~TRINITY_DN103727_c0_g1_i1.p2  ORF type:complete len:186 (-),score=24.70 TRINITY_DN103727_c0_g1_i1:75-632(-)